MNRRNRRNPIHRPLLAVATPFLVAALSCTSPVIRVEARYGEVIVPEAFGRETGEDLARSLDHLVPQVARFLSVAPGRGIKLRLLEEPMFDADGFLTWGALVTRPWTEIHIGSESMKRGLRPYVLAHELTHWHIREQGWKLPYLLEEGLAEFIGLVYAPRGSLRARVLEAKREGIEGDPRVLWSSREDHTSLGLEERRRTALSGFELARRMGIQRVMELAAEGDATPEDFLALLEP